MFHLQTARHAVIFTLALTLALAVGCQVLHGNCLQPVCLTCCLDSMNKTFVSMSDRKVKVQDEIIKVLKYIFLYIC